MDIIINYVNNLESVEIKERYLKIIEPLLLEHSDLVVETKYNLPTLTKDGCFIFSCSPFKNYISIMFEKPTLEHFTSEIKANNYNLTKTTFNIKYSQDIDYELLLKMIAFQLELRKGSNKFWY